jgi:hypothetical protein
MTSSTGVVVWRWQVDGFGYNAPLTDPGGNGTNDYLNLRFPGQIYDSETGFSITDGIRKMKIKQNILLLVVSFAAGLIFQIIFQWLGHSDSLGLWYTIYCAIAYTVPVFIVLKVGFWLYSRK